MLPDNLPYWQKCRQTVPTSARFRHDDVLTWSEVNSFSVNRAYTDGICQYSFRVCSETCSDPMVHQQIQWLSQKYCIWRVFSLNIYWDLGLFFGKLRSLKMNTNTLWIKPFSDDRGYRVTLAITRTTRTPAFWGYPSPPHDYPYHWVILDPKSKEDKVKVTNFKNSPKFLNFETGITRDTPS